MDLAGTTLTGGPELLVQVDRAAATPLYRQLADGLRAAVRAGRLLPGTRIPSTRALATDLGVSRRLVVEVYDQLVAEGFLVSRRGSGTVVARVNVADVHAPDPPTRPVYDVDFTPGTPDLAGLPRHAWLRALRAALASAPDDVFGYVDPQGLPATRAAVANYLRRTRAVAVGPEQIVLCSGVTQAVALLCQVCEQVGAHPIAVEDPGFWLHPRVLRHHGVDPIPVPVDDQGLDVDALTRTPARAVLCTPAHQAALGVVLSPERRVRLLDWARAGNWVVEDDYDAEYRYDRAPVGALQGLAPDRIVYTGSVSKTLAPGVRMGWLVLPEPLIEPLRRAKALTDLGTSVMDQLALSQLLSAGHYDRHLRGMRRRYKARRTILLRELATQLPEATVLGAAAGVQLTVELPPGSDVDAIVARAAEERVRVEPLHRCYRDRAAAPAGLTLGYANLTQTQLVAGVQALARAVRR